MTQPNEQNNVLKQIFNINPAAFTRGQTQLCPQLRDLQGLPKGITGFLPGGIFFQAHVGCWQNSGLCGLRWSFQFPLWLSNRDQYQIQQAYCIPVDWPPSFSKQQWWTKSFLHFISLWILPPAWENSLLCKDAWD